ncbi:MAG: hypothetical protein JW839_19645 [Candidatus Lokiarchaeota archaeon]|nr:hypothetical protein [Candidatus Lokiarchaeota archaeon]
MIGVFTGIIAGLTFWIAGQGRVHVIVPTMISGLAICIAAAGVQVMRFYDRDPVARSRVYIIVGTIFIALTGLSLFTVYCLNDLPLALIGLFVMFSGALLEDLAKKGTRKRT